MLDIVSRLINMKARPGGSIHDLHIEAAPHIEQMHKSLREMQEIALRYVEAGGPDDSAVEEAQKVLVTVGDGDALDAERQYERWLAKQEPRP